jgi:serpin B
MMHRQGGFRHYLERAVGTDRFEPAFHIAEVPYKGGELAAVFIVPGKHDRLPALEAKLSAIALNEWLGNATEAKKDTSIAIPKFRIETDSMMLNEALQKLGMVEAFSEDRADFSAMAADPLHVAAVVQKSFVVVNEEGTEAAAATGVVMADRSAGAPPFRADRPFLFLIRHMDSGMILFMGRMTRP